jgi:uncharacterized protein (TIGR03067 family)
MKFQMTALLLCAAIAATTMAGAFQKPVGGQLGRKSFEFDGAWIPVKAELGGQAVAAEQLKPIKLTLDRGAYEVSVNGKVIDRGRVNLVAQTAHPAMNVTGTEGPNKDKTFPAIYELAEDTMTICYNLKGETRPTAFKTEKGTHLYLVTYKREGK